jgi:hypothetical protein
LNHCSGSDSGGGIGRGPGSARLIGGRPNPGTGGNSTTGVKADAKNSYLAPLAAIGDLYFEVQVATTSELFKDVQLASN